MLNRYGLLPCFTALMVSTSVASGQPQLPPGFQSVVMSPQLSAPTAMAFAPDGRIFIAQKGGIVRVVQNGNLLATPFIDLSAEVNNAGDRGMLGIALDPNFATNRMVYLLYTVDPVAGSPDESAFEATFGRLTRYAGTAASNGAVADASTRTVLLGATPTTGIPVCWSSHTIGALRWGLDGSLFVSAGDGARYETTDSGGQTPGCLSYMTAAEDVGAFRAQMLNSLAGKILRINPANGQGYSSNPYFNGNFSATRSKVWVYGVRNSFRFAVRPGTPSPGAIFSGDVGWDFREELSFAPAGANLGWPCYEAFSLAPNYPGLSPPNGACSTIETPGNPGSLNFPLISYHHSNPSLSVPSGTIGQSLTAGVFGGNTYPGAFRGLFHADFLQGWIRVLKVDAANEYVGVVPFATDANGAVDFAIDPLTGDMCMLEYGGSRVVRFHSTIGPGDVNADGVVNVADLLGVIGGWGPCNNPPCDSDANGDGTTNVQDLLEVIGNWD